MLRFCPRCANMALSVVEWVKFRVNKFRQWEYLQDALALRYRRPAICTTHLTLRSSVSQKGTRRASHFGRVAWQQIQRLGGGKLCRKAGLLWGFTCHCCRGNQLVKGMSAGCRKDTAVDYPLWQQSGRSRMTCRPHPTLDHTPAYFEAAVTSRFDFMLVRYCDSHRYCSQLEFFQQ
jgi:hypothetical protein